MEVRAFGEVSEASGQGPPDIAPAGVIESWHASVRHHDIHVVGVLAFHALHVVAWQLDVVEFSDVIGAQEVDEADAVVAGCQLDLRTVGIDLHFHFLVEPSCRITLPFGGFAEFWEEYADVEESIHFHSQPVVPGRMGAEVTGVLAEGLEHGGDRISSEDRRAQHAEEAVLPDAAGADAGLNRPPA